MTDYSELKRLAEAGDCISCANIDPDQVLALIEELKIADKIIAERNKLLDAIPACPVHGQCVPHAIELVDKAMLVMRELKAENEALRNNQLSLDDFDLDAEFTAMRKDAERYRWLRDDKSAGKVDLCIMRKHWGEHALSKVLALDGADQQIDAAMNKELQNV